MLCTTPRGRAQIVETFGDPDDPDFERTSISVFDLPYPLRYSGTGKVVARSRAHRLLVPTFVRVLRAIAEAGLAGNAADYAGIYCRRPVRRGRKPSTHSWGIAIDLNPGTNRLGTIGDMIPEVVALFRREGFVWGGDFRTPDPMHFQFASGY